MKWQKIQIAYLIRSISPKSAVSKLCSAGKNAQLDALLMQINPHFLYNTLDIIRWEAMYEANGESPRHTND